MKEVIKKLKVVLVIGMITVPTILMARGPEDEPPGGPGDPMIDAPFDGGVSLLVAAVIAYGLKRKYNKKKAGKEIEVLEK